MPIEGKPLQPRALAELFYEAGWRDTPLVEAVAVCLSESGGYPIAWHDNLDSQGNVTSRDVGLMQINIPAADIGTSVEKDLYDVTANVTRARAMYVQRGWEPWYGYTNGYATSTDWWHWSTTRSAWVPTGRYLHRAIRGVANYFAVKYGLSPVPFTDYYSIPSAPTLPPVAAPASGTDERGLMRGYEDIPAAYFSAD